ncbi:MAG: hypothetical protein QOG50_2768 [Actinomycetota bacterium]|nr:hypothetical protein [Actinomycetota bacterium]
MEQALTNEQAFEAMRNFLAQFNEREPVERRESIAQLLRWTARGDWADGSTNDPAQWFDWLEAVAKALREFP